MSPFASKRIKMLGNRCQRLRTLAYSHSSLCMGNSEFHFANNRVGYILAACLALDLRRHYTVTSKRCNYPAALAGDVNGGLLIRRLGLLDLTLRNYPNPLPMPHNHDMILRRFKGLEALPQAVNLSGV